MSLKESISVSCSPFMFDSACSLLSIDPMKSNLPETLLSLISTKTINVSIFHLLWKHESKIIVLYLKLKQCFIFSVESHVICGSRTSFKHCKVLHRFGVFISKSIAPLLIQASFYLDLSFG